MVTYLIWLVSDSHSPDKWVNKTLITLSNINMLSCKLINKIWNCFSHSAKKFNNNHRATEENCKKIHRCSAFEYAYIQDSEKKVFSDFGSNPFMAIGGGEPSAKWESDNALNIRKIVEKNCSKCKSKIRNKFLSFYQQSVLKIWFLSLLCCILALFSFEHLNAAFFYYHFT